MTNPEDQEQPEDPQWREPWQKILAFLKEEGLWLAETLGIVTVTLMIERVLKLMGIDVSTLSSTSWHDVVHRVLNPEQQKPEEPRNEDRSDQ